MVIWLGECQDFFKQRGGPWDPYENTITTFVFFFFFFFSVLLIIKKRCINHETRVQEKDEESSPQIQKTNQDKMNSFTIQGDLYKMG